MQLFRRAVAPLLGGALVISALPLAAATASAPATTAPAAAVVAVEAKPKPFRVTPGITFNSPLGSRATKRNILNKQLAAINHARPGSTIKIMTWNFMSEEGRLALMRAQRRGVVVRLLMDASNVDADTPNPAFRKLKRGLAAGNANRRAVRRSYAKTCKASCRGRYGAAHAKFFLFSKTGASRHVFMHGSANLTTAAAINQWNEVYTFVDAPGMYGFAERVFDEMWRDKPAKHPYESFGRGRFKMMFSPYAGPNFSSDPVQDALDRVRCRGAVRAGNSRGRTIVRSAPDVIRGKRGMTAARQLKALWDRGCDVRVVYTVMGVDVRRVLKSGSGRGPVPMRHLVQDFDGDGDFDNYFHIKVLTINGVLGNDRTTHLSFNGSSNTSDLATRSDENIGTIVGRGPTLRYQKHIDYWFENPPPNPCADKDPEDRPESCENSTSANGDGANARMFRVVDPYQNVDLD